MISYKKWKSNAILNAQLNAKYTQVNGIQVQYTDIGKGFPVIHSHGSPTSADSGVRAFRPLTEMTNIRLLTPARPGFLGTPLSIGQSIGEQADLFVNLMDKLQIPQAFLFSWSSGGPPAIAAAAKYPKRFKGLILYSSLAHQWEFKMSLLDKLMIKDPGIWMIELIRKRNPEKFRENICKSSGWDYNVLKKDPKSIKMIDTFFEFMTPASIRNKGSMNDVKNYVGFKQNLLESIKIPKLVIFSPNNKKLNYSHGLLAASKIPGAQFINYQHGAHFFPVDKRSHFIYDEIRSFIDRYAI